MPNELWMAIVLVSQSKLNIALPLLPPPAIGADGSAGFERQPALDGGSGGGGVAMNMVRGLGLGFL
uniref:Uncharacterized protein n=1 Tax=Oryza sativa subsp. japonica TaxID=39947 RepID=Q6YVF1_ORYSJ|nr:hypothetical protein [Oryza sativa Japonica Group]BAD17654.1 hypothetical protein [Oryza sativa Japonica Group]